MTTNARRLTGLLLALALSFDAAVVARAAPPPGASPAGAIGRTPPRLSYTSGEVSFWRPGAQDWAPAQVNTPLAPGDELFTGNPGDLELQVGTRAFVRAWGDTQLGLANQEPDFLQLKVTSGHVSLDLRSLDPGHGVELDTPHAAFTIEYPGYYRADVTQERTSFVTRRAGRATMTPAGGQVVAIAPSEEVILENAPAATGQSYVAPELDTWDQWNYERTDHLLEAMSARYVPSEVYGADDLDHYGTWRVVRSYGPVWVPEAVPTGWAPYSTGRWVSDPYYGWTWVDTAPWGWAPYHYGRWVSVDGFWAWAPGPLVARPVYAPALVAFFGAPGITVSVSVPVVSWVPLSWGEPVVPWWGPTDFVGRPRWVGWGGPRIVNNVVVNRTTIVDVKNITVYRNVTVQNAVVAVRQDQFGGRPVQEARVAEVDVRRLEPVRGPLRVTTEASSFVAASGHAERPPEVMLARPVVATRPLAARPVMPRGEAQRGAPVVLTPAPRIGSAPRAAQAGAVPPRAPFGTSEMERQRPEAPPRLGRQRPEAALAAPGDSARRPERGESPQPAPPAEHRSPAESIPQPRSAFPSAAAPPPQQVEAERSPRRPLPGEPANRLSPGRAQTAVGRPAAGPAPEHPGPVPAAPREREQR